MNISTSSLLHRGPLNVAAKHFTVEPLPQLDFRASCAPVKKAETSNNTEVNASGGSGAEKPRAVRVFTGFAKLFTRRSVATPTTSYLAPGLIVAGEMFTEAELEVDGRVEGAVRCSVLRLGENGVVLGPIDAEEAHIDGLVRGNILADRVRLGPTARLAGDVSYYVIRVADGARVEGKMIQRSGSD